MSLDEANGRFKESFVEGGNESLSSFVLNGRREIAAICSNLGLSMFTRINTKAS